MNQPLCSILIPSRKRLEKLIRCINSIKDSAAYPGCFEIVLRLHRDDTATLSSIPFLVGLGNVRIAVGSPLRGYQDLSRFYEDAAALAHGKFIWVMNDDVVVSGAPWDTALRQATENGCIIMPEIHRLGNSEYRNDLQTPFMFLPNGCWKQYGINRFDDPFDCALWNLLRNHRWPTYFLPGVSVWHDREEDKTLLAARAEDEAHMENL